MKIQLDTPSFVYKDRQATIEVYLYTDSNIVIPRDADGVYGSKLMKIVAHENLIFMGEYFVNKNMVKRLKSTSFGCKDYEKNDSVGQCIVRFVEETSNCTTNHIFANKTKEPCDEAGDTKSDANHTHISVLSEYGIYNLTGCLPPCEHDEIEAESMENSHGYQRGQGFLLEFQFKDGMYQTSEEYIVYDADSFIADVGGYLGLLLGHSMLSIYSNSVELLTKSGKKVLKQLN